MSAAAAFYYKLSYFKGKYMCLGATVRIPQRVGEVGRKRYQTDGCGVRVDIGTYHALVI